jgi:uncharacterized protein
MRAKSTLRLMVATASTVPKLRRAACAPGDRLVGFSRLAAAIAAAILSFPALAAEPSFDCSSPASAAEEAVCTSDALAAMDVELGRLYRAAAEGSNMTPDRLGELRSTQRGWIKGRDECWKAQELERCVRDEYAIRIFELRQGYADARSTPGASRGPFVWECAGLDARLGTVFVEGPAPVAVLQWRDTRVVLPQTVSGSGARYADGPVVFWIKGDSASLTPPGGAETDCRLDGMD